jgi:xanthine dehydrogenase YagR molybdenum-binding subunit
MSASHDGTAVLTLVGSPMNRVDGRLKVTGGARYAADSAVDGALYAVAVQSTIARGRIRAFDEAATRAIEGVREVLTHRNAPRVPPVPFGESPNTEPNLPPLQSDEIHYWGQHIAVVVAQSYEAARAGASALRVEYDAGPGVFDIAEIRESAPGSPPFFDWPLHYKRGDAEKAFAAAAVSVDARYRTPIENHNPIEPSATVASWNEAGELVVHDSTQWVQGTQSTLAAFFKIDKENVRVFSPFIGGGFGCKGFTWPHPVIAAMAAKVTGSPVRLVLTREQMFTSCGHRSETEQRLRIAADADGKIVAMCHDVLTATSRVGMFVEGAGIVTPFLYACPNIAIEHRTGLLDIGTPTAMRAPGETPGTFALESAIDELAEKLAIDPLEFRLRNYSERSEYEDREYSSKALRACYTRAAEKFGWSKRPAAVRAMQEDGELIGWGMATATYPAMRGDCSARVTMDAAGRVTIVSATHDLGTGMYTILTQIAADALGVQIDNITVRIGDSALPPAPVAGGSQSTASVAPAVFAAANDIRAQAISLAVAAGSSPLHGLAAGDVEVRDGRLWARGDASRSMAWGDAVRLSGAAALEATHSTEGGEAEKKYSLHSFGAHFCEVRFDEDLARLRVTRFVSAMDCGRILNAKTARSQVIGGVIMGIGQALFEETVRDSRYGSIVTNNLADYHVPVNADVPELGVIFVEEPDMNFNPLGVRGIGEIGITGVAAAIANATYHATGIRVRDLPIVPEKLLAQV